MPTYSLNGKRPSVPADGQYWIAPNATVIGDVQLASEASIWFGVTVRADHAHVAIGARSNIQEHCVLHVDADFPIEIGSDTTIGHAAIVHGSRIGDGVIVGMGAIVMNGASIGNGSIVAAGAVVPEGKSFPDHSLIMGAPAKVVRVLDEAAASRIRKVADTYVGNWKSMATGLQPCEPAR